MNKQTEALRLAEWLQANYEADEIDQAADLLRKLFADKEKLERLLTTSANCERRLHALNKELQDTIDSIYIYANDTLSGRTDGPDDRDWQRAGVVEIRNRARKHATVDTAISARAAFAKAEGEQA